ncbi:MAG TPA: glycine zipper family protein [Rubrivivax sp.]|nr:glycine zipper family protein [Rubrivivax sp.]
MKHRIVWILALSTALVSSVAAQQFVYPAKGQSPQQQKSDEAACYSWAVQQTGFDPAKPPPQQAAAKPPTTAAGTTPGAGVRGAVGGAAIGAIAGDAGAGAAAGAVVARSSSRRQNAAAGQQAQQQQQASSQQQQAAFGKARAACLEGRGYSVK